MALLKKWCWCGTLQACAIFMSLALLIFHVISLVICCFRFLESVDYFGYSKRYYKLSQEGAIIISLLSALSVIGILINLGLLISACKKKTPLLLVWLVSYGAVLYVLPFVMLNNALSSFLYRQYLYFNGYLLIGLPLTMFGIYCWFCILSFYQRLKKKEIENEEKVEISLDVKPDAENLPSTSDSLK